MIALALIVVAAAIYLGFTLTANRKRARFVSGERATLHYSAIAIICGNCSGEERIPLKTFMNRHGACEVCGGDSYILASHRGAYLRGLIPGYTANVAAATADGDGVVVPFEPRQRPASPEKVAV